MSLWTAGALVERAGLTVTSMLVAAGDPARVVVLLHPDADLLERIEETSAAVVSLLTWRHRELAEVFAGRFGARRPLPTGGVGADGWGPRLVSAPSWLGVRADARSRGTSGGRSCSRPSSSMWRSARTPWTPATGDSESSRPLFHRRGRYLGP